jgi:PAS domain-containing protein
VRREQVERVLVERIRAGEDLAAKAEVANRTGGYRDWLHLFATWRDDTIAELKAAYEGKDIAQEFGRQTALRWGIQKLETLIERLQLALPESQDVAGIKSLHPEIYSRCRTLYAGADYAEAVEKGFKIVRDRLRSLTGYETGSEAFGKGKLYIIRGAAAPHVDDDFQNGVKFLTIKSHTADGNIRDPIRAYEPLGWRTDPLNLRPASHETLVCGLFPFAQHIRAQLIQGFGLLHRYR